jgi:hypothetical protein
VKFGSGWLVGTQLGYWFSDNIGIRANGRYADRDVQGNDLDDVSFINSVNLWSATGDLLLRFVKPAEEYSSMEFLPYLALGAGLRWQNRPATSSPAISRRTPTPRPASAHDWSAEYASYVRGR